MSVEQQQFHYIKTLVRRNEQALKLKSRYFPMHEQKEAARLSSTMNELLSAQIRMAVEELKANNQVERCHGFNEYCGDLDTEPRYELHLYFRLTQEEFFNVFQVSVPWPEMREITVRLRTQTPIAVGEEKSTCMLDHVQLSYCMYWRKPTRNHNSEQYESFFRVFPQPGCRYYMNTLRNAMFRYKQWKWCQWRRHLLTIAAPPLYSKAEEVRDEVEIESDESEYGTPIDEALEEFLKCKYTNPTESQQKFAQRMLEGKTEQMRARITAVVDLMISDGLVESFDGFDEACNETQSNNYTSVKQYYDLHHFFTLLQNPALGESDADWQHSNVTVRSIGGISTVRLQFRFGYQPASPRDLNWLHEFQTPPPFGFHRTVHPLWIRFGRAVNMFSDWQCSEDRKTLSGMCVQYDSFWDQNNNNNNNNSGYQEADDIYNNNIA